MPTSALVEQSPASPVLGLAASLECRAPNRPIACSAAVSVLLHVAALAIIGVLGLTAAEPGRVPALQLFIEPRDGRDPERDSLPPAQHTTAPSKNTVSPDSPARVARKRVPDREAATKPDSPPPAQTETANVAGASAPVGFLTSAGAIADSDSSASSNPTASTASGASPDSMADAGSVADVPLLTTASASDSSMRAAAAAAPSPLRAAPFAITPGQKAALTRWITAGVQGLRNTDAPQTLTWEQDGNEYTALMRRTPASDSTGIERIIVEIVTEDHGTRLHTHVQMKRLAFSHFTQLVDHWDPHVQLHDDEIAGRFHSNTRILLGYDRMVAPAFLGKVTTAARGFSITNARGYKRRDEIFRGGLETQADRIVLPASFTPFTSSTGSMNPPPDSDIWSFDQDTRITFYEDGSYGWRELRAAGPERLHPFKAGSTTYIVGTRDASAFVRGKVRGKVLLYAPRRIVIEGDLRYTQNPRYDSGSLDYLGLVSDKYVEIAPPRVTGPGDLHIDGAIYARRRFAVPDTDQKDNGVLSIYGSLTAGSITATEPRYATKVEFDPRFETARPPGFPVTDRYEVESWDGGWQPLDEDAATGLDTPAAPERGAPLGTRNPAAH